MTYILWATEDSVMFSRKSYRKARWRKAIERRKKQLYNRYPGLYGIHLSF